MRCGGDRAIKPLGATAGGDQRQAKVCGRRRHAYFEPDELYPLGGFCCQHSHRDKYHIRALLEFLGVRNAEARNKPVIRVVAGDLHRVVDAAEKELANRGRHYQAGGLIVSVCTDPTSGDPKIVPTSAPAKGAPFDYLVSDTALLARRAFDFLGDEGIGFLPSLKP